MLNVVAVNGRLTSDIRVTKVRDTKVANFTVAVKKNYKNKNGNYDTSFFPVTIWGASVDYLEKHSSKGSLVSVSGELNSRIRKSEGGTSDMIIEILANNVNILEYKERKVNPVVTNTTSSSSVNSIQLSPEKIIVNTQETKPANVDVNNITDETFDPFNI